MKRAFFCFTFLLILLLNIFPPQIKNVQADSGYARILNENTCFYANPDCTIQKFILPYGYFIKIIQVGIDSTKVCYMDGKNSLPESVGYVKTCDLFFSDITPQNPYPDLILTVKSDEILFADGEKNHPKTVLSEGDKAHFYGETVLNGEVFCYVYSNGFIGYVRKNGFVNFTLPPHELPIKQNNSSELQQSESDFDFNSQKDQTATTPADETLKTVIIVAVCIVCLSVVYLIFKPASQTFKPAITKDDDDFF